MAVIQKITDIIDQMFHKNCAGKQFSRKWWEVGDIQVLTGRICFYKAKRCQFYKKNTDVIDPIVHKNCVCKQFSRKWREVGDVRELTGRICFYKAKRCQFYFRCDSRRNVGASRGLTTTTTAAADSASLTRKGMSHLGALHKTHELYTRLMAVQK